MSKLLRSALRAVNGPIVLAGEHDRVVRRESCGRWPCLHMRGFFPHVLVCGSMIRPPDRQLLGYLAPYDPHISDLTLALREVVLEEAPNAIESIVKGYAVAIGFSFTGKPLKDGFCHIVTYGSHVNLGFNRGAQLHDPSRILKGKGKAIRHVTFNAQSELDNPIIRRYLQAAIEEVSARTGKSGRKSLKS